MNLNNWLRNRWLVTHKTTPGEIANLLALADRALKDSGVAGLSADGRFCLAYSAALQAATAALAAAGFRPARGEAHHYRVIQSLAHTVGVDASTIDRLDAFRKKRNVADYERAGTVSDHEVAEITALARQLRRQVENWLHADHPALLER